MQEHVHAADDPSVPVIVEFDIPNIVLERESFLRPRCAKIGRMEGDAGVGGNPGRSRPSHSDGDQIQSEHRVCKQPILPAIRSSKNLTEAEIRTLIWRGTADNNSVVVVRKGNSVEAPVGYRVNHVGPLCTTVRGVHNQSAVSDKPTVDTIGHGNKINAAWHIGVHGNPGFATIGVWKMVGEVRLWPQPDSVVIMWMDW